MGSFPGHDRKACPSFDSEKGGGRQAADSATYDVTIKGFSGVDGAGGNGIKGVIMDSVSTVHDFRGIPV